MPEDKPHKYRSRVRWTDVQTGRPLPWDVYTRTGRLLLRQGSVPTTEGQIAALVLRGTYHDEPEAPDRPQDADERAQRDLLLAPPPDDISAASAELRDVLAEGLEGGASDFVERTLDTARQLQGAAMADPDRALALALLRDDEYALAHAVHAALLADRVAQRLGASAEERLSLIAAGITHDIALLPLQLMFERNAGPLTGDQWELVRAHPQEGVAKLRALGVADPAWLRAVHGHHERADGSGYPQGRAGDQWPQEARILAVADAYTAMIRPRAYRPAHDPRQALKNLFLERGRTIDAHIAEILIKETGLYPPGALVRLANGETGVVVARGDNAAHPVVYGVLGRGGHYLMNIEPRDTRLAEHAIVSALPRAHYAGLYRRLSHLWNQPRA